MDNLWVVLIQRFCYRQFMYFVTLRALFSAIKGDRQRWNKLDRRASVGIAGGWRDGMNPARCNAQRLQDGEAARSVRRGSRNGGNLPTVIP